MTDQILTTSAENARTPVLLDPERAAAVVAGWREDPIDTWRKQQKKFDRVWPRSAGDELPPHVALAAATCERVATRLRALGYRVKPSAPNASWDLLVEGCLRVEVKASEWREQKPDRGRRLPRHRYQANVRAKQASRVDLVIFVAVSGTDHHFIIPRAALAGRQSLTIRQRDPAAYAGNLAEFYEAWQLIDPALEVAKERPEQGRLL